MSATHAFCLCGHSQASHQARGCTLCACSGFDLETIEKLRAKLEGVRKLAADRQLAIDQLKRAKPPPSFKDDDAAVRAVASLRERMLAQTERAALEASRADMLHATLNAISLLPLWALDKAHRHLLDEADDVLALSRNRRAASHVECSSCGAAYGLEQWLELPSRGLQEQADLPADPLELRNCSACRSTLALPLRRLPVTK